MWPLKSVHIAEGQRAIWLKNGNFKAVLMPGRFRFWQFSDVHQVKSYDSGNVEVTEPGLRNMAKLHGEQLQRHMLLVELAEHEAGLLRVNGIARKLLMPGTVAAFWHHVHEVAVERLSVIAGAALPQSWQDDMRHVSADIDVLSRRKLILPVSVAAGHQGILQINGTVERLLPPGEYAFWRGAQNLSCLIVDMRGLSLEVNGQEILTKDRVSLRINTELQYRVVDAVKSQVEMLDAQDRAYRAVQFRVDS